MESQQPWKFSVWNATYHIPNQKVKNKKSKCTDIAMGKWRIMVSCKSAILVCAPAWVYEIHLELSSFSLPLSFFHSIFVSVVTANDLLYSSYGVCVCVPIYMWLRASERYGKIDALKSGNQMYQNDKEINNDFTFYSFAFFQVILKLIWWY